MICKKVDSFDVSEKIIFEEGFFFFDFFIFWNILLKLFLFVIYKREKCSIYNCFKK